MKHIAIILLIFLSKTAISQTPVDQYYDFSLHLSEGNAEKAMEIAEKLIPSATVLSKKQQAIFYFKLGRLYEDSKNKQKAIVFYEKSLTLEPNYYVPHLALGYLYLDHANALSTKMKAEKTNASVNQRYMAEYKGILKKAVPHLEKAVACDPNDQVLTSIKNIYLALDDAATYKSLDSRIDELNKNCVTVLTEDF
ncbi:tetratricopeptide repeat protein [Arcticibacter sp.]|jgi:tetratricopeptide (TPR) repeat protein|uniref:tetratricopeptide repeat protein n=1 Tax=Arcticibacter sp. TaxID=1872630 RepID=UPI00388F0BDB